MNQQPFIIVTTFCLLAFASLPPAARAADAPETSQTTAAAASETDARPQWQRKLDRTLQAAADQVPDVMQRLLITTTDRGRTATIAMLTRAGFDVDMTCPSDGLVISATARDAVVLAEDGGIQTISVHPGQQR